MSEQVCQEGGALACARWSACGCPKGDHYISLDIAEALCEAKWGPEAFLRSALVALDSMVMCRCWRKTLGSESNELLCMFVA
jgi:hypothetical protein